MNPETSLGDLGLDSLMGVEVKQTLEHDLQLVLSMKEIRSLNINKLKQLTQGGDKVKTVEEKKESKQAPHSKEKVEHNYNIQLNDELMPTQTVVRLNKGGNVNEDCVPLFIVHPIEGNVACFEELASHLGGAPVYGVQCTAEAPLQSIQALAQYYVEVKLYYY